jgi:1-deoxyxylulose-5-phosphate synthase
MTFGLQSDESTAGAILDRAAEGGIDFLDSSDAYPLGGDLSTRGITEEILGRWLRGKRDRFIVATKCFAPTGPAPFDAGNSRKHIMSAVEASLRRLQTDYIDLHQLHGYDRATPIDETLGAPIIGASRPDQLQASLAAADLVLDGDLKRRLDELTHQYRMGDAPR